MQLHISILIAKALTYLEIVTEHNIDYLDKYVKNGVNIYPGANSVFQNGIHMPLNDINNTIKLEPGNIVERHIIDGDIILLTEDILKYGRKNQPSYIVLIDPKLEGVCMKKIIYIPSFHADFDGDELQ